MKTININQSSQKPKTQTKHFTETTISQVNLQTTSNQNEKQTKQTSVNTPENFKPNKNKQLK